LRIHSRRPRILGRVFGRIVPSYPVFIPILAGTCSLGCADLIHAYKSSISIDSSQVTLVNHLSVPSNWLESIQFSCPFLGSAGPSLPWCFRLGNFGHFELECLESPIWEGCLSCWGTFWPRGKKNLSDRQTVGIGRRSRSIGCLVAYKALNRRFHVSDGLLRGRSHQSSLDGLSLDAQLTRVNELFNPQNWIDLSQIGLTV